MLAEAQGEAYNLTRWRQGGSRVQGHLPSYKASLGCTLPCFQTNNSLGEAWQGETKQKNLGLKS